LRVAGAWTDDTAMAICLAASLLERGRFDARDQMDRYSRWAGGDYLGDTGTNLDMGFTVAAAIRAFQETGEAYAGSPDPHTAGNGCIMRLAPVPMFYFSDLEAMERNAAASSRTTHGAAECVDACRLMARIIGRALQGKAKDEVALGDRESFVGAEKIVAIARGDYRGRAEAEVRGSGYVVDSLEAAMWCFDRANSFSEAVLLAVNLGDDADTTGAVCGQIAGAFYGASGIPSRWLSQLAQRGEIVELADRLHAHAASAGPR
jgi:ADP-ribosyl-[dinitrogen reductase] hydrolase